VETPGRKIETEKPYGCLQASKDPVHIMTLNTLPLLILHLWPVCIGELMGRSDTGGQSLYCCPVEGGHRMDSSSGKRRAALECRKI
jgi:hypothetical protein